MRQFSITESRAADAAEAAYRRLPAEQQTLDAEGICRLRLAAAWQHTADMAARRRARHAAAWARHAAADAADCA